ARSERRPPPPSPRARGRAGPPEGPPPARFPRPLKPPAVPVVLPRRGEIPPAHRLRPIAARRAGPAARPGHPRPFLPGGPGDGRTPPPPRPRRRSLRVLQRTLRALPPVVVGPGMRPGRLPRDARPRAPVLGPVPDPRARRPGRDAQYPVSPGPQQSARRHPRGRYPRLGRPEQVPPPHRSAHLAAIPVADAQRRCPAAALPVHAHLRGPGAGF